MSGPPHKGGDAVEADEGHEQTGEREAAEQGGLEAGAVAACADLCHECLNIDGLVGLMVAI